MPSRKTRIRPSQADALHGQGPRSGESPARARPDSDKPGPGGDGLVLPQREKAEIVRRAAAFCQELRPSGEVGQVLVRLAATMSVRMERCVTLENAAMTDRVRRAIADFTPPPGVDDAEAARLRADAGLQAMFDTSKEATQARRYEAAAQRSFFRALEELRRIEKAAKAAEAEAKDELTRELLASFSSVAEEDTRFEALFAASRASERQNDHVPPANLDFSRLGGRSNLPLTVGRRR